MRTLEERVAAIETRNKRVELDKKWETSFIRRVSIAVLTYGVVVSYLFVIDNDSPFVNGLVPAAGYVLSTLAIKAVRLRWENHENK